jgi:transposase
MLDAQAIQDIAQRIDKAYQLFFDNLKRKVRTAPPGFKKSKSIVLSHSSKPAGSWSVQTSL